MGLVVVVGAGLSERLLARLSCVLVAGGQGTGNPATRLPRLLTRRTEGLPRFFVILLLMLVVLVVVVATLLGPQVLTGPILAFIRPADVLIRPIDVLVGPVELLT